MAQGIAWDVKYARRILMLPPGKFDYPAIVAGAANKYTYVE